MDTALPGFSRDAVAAVQSRLDDAETDGAHILLAIESGSRAWGFPSPDSDYDCRFIYARSGGDHVRLTQPRDVIEFPIEGAIDAGGWDLRKALLLALAGNAVIFEWATSPYTYRVATGFRERLTPVLEQIIDPERVARHYVGLAHTQLQRASFHPNEVKLKKLFYVVRPLIALDWMERRDFKVLPPMNLLRCLEGISLHSEVSDEIHQMIARKGIQREMGTGPVPAPILTYLMQRYEYHSAREFRFRGATERDERYQFAEDFYRSEVERLS